MRAEVKDRSLVSIVIPTYNGEKFLADSIESVLNQTYANFELIICDDASDDQTVEILKKFKKSDSRISVFSFSENAGLAGNWNRGLRKAQGKYIKMLCQDDLIYPTYLEETTNVLKNNKSVCLVCSYEKTIGQVEKIRSSEVFPGVGELNGTWSQDQIVKNGNWIGAPSATIFRRESLKEIGLFDDTFLCGLDWEMWLRLLGYGSLFVIPRVLYSTRIHPEQESSRCTGNLGFLKDRISIFRNIEKTPNRYGREDWQIPGKTYRRAVNQFLEAASKKPSQICDAVRFLNQYQSPVSSWIAIAYVLLQGFLKSLKPFIKQENN